MARFNRYQITHRAGQVEVKGIEHGIIDTPYRLTEDEAHAAVTALNNHASACDGQHLGANMEEYILVDAVIKYRAHKNDRRAPR